MNTIGFQKQEKVIIYQLISTILHLGNVKFATSNTYHGSEGVFITTAPGITRFVLSFLPFQSRLSCFPFSHVFFAKLM